MELNAQFVFMLIRPIVARFAFSFQFVKMAEGSHETSYGGTVVLRYVCTTRHGR
jgi:hypothetical protein